MNNFTEFSYYLQEAGSGAGNKGLEMEKVIIAALTGGKYKPTNKTIGSNAGKKIIKKVKLSGSVREMNKSYEVTRQWTSYFPRGKVGGGTKTPKTDMIVGGKRISLKTAQSDGKNDNAYLVGATKSEAQAIFYSACKASRISNKKIVKRIGKHFNKMYVSKVVEVKGDAKELKANLKSQMVNRGQEFRNVFLGDLKELFDEDIFSYHYTLEAMTGRTKFGPKSEAAAEWCLIVDNTGDKAVLHNLFKDKAFVNKVKARTKLQVRFGGSNTKSTGGYSTWTHTVNQYVEKLSRLTEEAEHLTEIELWNKFKNAMVKMFNKVIEWIGDSWQKLLEFFEVEPRISFKNNISW